MRPEHMHNHLRLCLRSHRFYELTGARYAAGASLSPSKPFRPQIKLRLQLKAEGSKLKAVVVVVGVCERAEFGSKLSYIKGFVKI